MKLTERDIRLVRDICLSHAMSRDQILALGYFSSISRANRRLNVLTSAKYLKVLDVPFRLQRLYIAGARAVDIVGTRIASLVTSRAGTPRFLQHALAVNDVRIQLTREQAENWRFEAQVRDQFQHCSKTVEVRPDGAVLTDSKVQFIEADLGNVSSFKFSGKISSYLRYLQSSRLHSVYGDRSVSVLIVTTGKLRLINLRSLVPSGSACFEFKTFSDIGANVAGGWS